MSKIPEGATHCVGRGMLRTFCKIIDMEWFAYSDGDWLSAGKVGSGQIIPEPELMPRVGSIVRCGTHSREVEVLKEPELVPYVSAPCRALDNNELFWGGQFSTIKTPEQIAAMERSLACDRIYGVITGAGVERKGNASDMAEALYDAGLRFVEVTK